MTNSNGNRFSPLGNWKAADDGGLGGIAFEVQALMERSLLCERLEDLPHIIVPEELRNASREFAPIAFSSPPTVTSVRVDDCGSLTDFLGVGRVQGDEIAILVTLQHGDGHYILWSPISIVP